MNEDSDQVGYRQPPKHSQFQKGRSGNPSGRPKGATGLKADFLAELNEFVTVTEDGKPKRMRKGRVVIKALIAKAAKGHVVAADKVLSLIIQMFGFEDERHAEKALSATDQAILDQWLQPDDDTNNVAPSDDPSGDDSGSDLEVDHEEEERL